MSIFLIVEKETG